MSDTVQFEELPPQGSTVSREGRGKHQRIAEQLRAQPGQWARVATLQSANSMNSTAYQIRTGYYSSYRPKGSFEASARTVNGERLVYARYVGENGEYR